MIMRSNAVVTGKPLSPGRVLAEVLTQTPKVGRENLGGLRDALGSTPKALIDTTTAAPISGDIGSFLGSLRTQTSVSF